MKTRETSHSLDCEQLLQRIVKLEKMLLAATERIASLEAENARLREENRQLREENARLQAEVERLGKENTRLEQQLAAADCVRHSSNDCLFSAVCGRRTLLLDDQPRRVSLELV